VLPVTLDDGATMPMRAHPADAGLDLWATEPVGKILPGQVREIPTGVHVAIPPGYVGRIEGRSGMARKGLVTHQGIIDSGYTGEIVVVMYNNGLNHVTPEPGRAVAQLVIYPCLLATPLVMGDLPATARGAGGFGSTDGKGGGS
jgi:dUTP pyrophosphatase